MSTYIPVSGYTAYYDVTTSDGRAISTALPVVAVQAGAVQMGGGTTVAMVIDHRGHLVPVDQAKLRDGRFRFVGPTPTPMGCMSP